MCSFHLAHLPILPAPANPSGKQQKLRKGRTNTQGVVVFLQVRLRGDWEPHFFFHQAPLHNVLFPPGTSPNIASTCESKWEAAETEERQNKYTGSGSFPAGSSPGRLGAPLFFPPGTPSQCALSTWHIS